MSAQVRTPDTLTHIHRAPGTAPKETAPRPIIVTHSADGRTTTFIQGGASLAITAGTDETVITTMQEDGSSETSSTPNYIPNLAGMLVAMMLEAIKYNQDLNKIMNDLSATLAKTYAGFQPDGSCNIKDSFVYTYMNDAINAGQNEAKNQQWQAIGSGISAGVGVLSLGGVIGHSFYTSLGPVKAVETQLKQANTLKGELSGGIKGEFVATERVDFVEARKNVQQLRTKAEEAEAEHQKAIVARDELIHGKDGKPGCSDRAKIDEANEKWKETNTRALEAQSKADDAAKALEKDEADHRKWLSDRKINSDDVAKIKEALKAGNFEDVYTTDSSTEQAIASKKHAINELKDKGEASKVLEKLQKHIKRLEAQRDNHHQNHAAKAQTINIAAQTGQAGATAVGNYLAGGQAGEAAINRASAEVANQVNNAYISEVGKQRDNANARYQAAGDLATQIGQAVKA